MAVYFAQIQAYGILSGAMIAMLITINYHMQNRAIKTNLQCSLLPSLIFLECFCYTS